MADFSHSVADLPNMLHLRARTFAPLAAFRALSFRSLTVLCMGVPATPH
jgi:hypothetical protein